jgi:hypothetical protein
MSKGRKEGKGCEEVAVMVEREGRRWGRGRRKDY